MYGEMFFQYKNAINGSLAIHSELRWRLAQSSLQLASQLFWRELLCPDHVDDSRSSQLFRAHALFLIAVRCDWVNQSAHTPGQNVHHGVVASHAHRYLGTLQDGGEVWSVARKSHVPGFAR